MSGAGRGAAIGLALIATTAASLLPWHADHAVRSASGLVLGVLVLWVSEIAPAGVIALVIPIAATLLGLLPWKEALATWGDPIVFLFFGAFLLARALDKFGVFDRLISAPQTSKLLARGPGRALMAILLVSGALSTVQNNTAVAAMLLPAVVTIARRSSAAAAPIVVALSYGATFGGLATPVGTAPNLIGYAQIQKFDAGVNFLTWMRVGVPAWLGTTLIAWGVLIAARRLMPATAGSADTAAAATSRLDDVGPRRLEHAGGVGEPTRTLDEDELLGGRRWAIGAAVATVVTWLGLAATAQSLPVDHAAAVALKQYLPESLPPLAAAWVLFLARVGKRGRSVLDRHDFQSLDWDTLFLIAGGMCLGAVLERSGAAAALAAAVGQAAMPPVLLMFALGGVTVLLSELISNTATASLLVPIAATLAPALHLSPVHAIWLVALSASLGFALPVSTPPNAIVYGTRLVPFRFMLLSGVVVDALTLAWVVVCVRFLA